MSGDAWGDLIETAVMKGGHVYGCDVPLGLSPRCTCAELRPPSEQPHHPLNQQYLPLLVEEAAEVQQAAAKIMRFGIRQDRDASAARSYDNVRALANEVGDLLEIIDRLGLPPILVAEARERKRERLKTYGPDGGG